MWKKWLHPSGESRRDQRYGSMPLIMHPPTYPTEKKLTHLARLLGFAPDYWDFHPTTGLFTRRLGFAPEDWALHPKTGLCTRLLGFSPDDWALHPKTGLCTRLLGFHANTKFLTQTQKAHTVQTNVLSWSISHRILSHY